MVFQHCLGSFTVSDVSFPEALPLRHVSIGDQAAGGLKRVTQWVGAGNGYFITNYLLPLKLLFSRIIQITLVMILIS